MRKNKTVFNRVRPLLLAFLTLGLTLSVSSCSDDDKLTDEQKEEKAYEEQQARNISQNVLSQLTDADLSGTDWLSGTYAPTIGQPDNGKEAVRVINTGDIETAAQRFCDLIGIAIDGFSIDKDYTWKDDNIGTLTWHQTGTGSLATVACDIKQMPGLSQIVYKTSEQMGTNSNFKGTAYYRFGDVVRKQNSDGDYDYWVCVRPAFGPEDKEESHWITLSPLPSKNTEVVTKGGTRFMVPKGLTTKTEHLQNMAEMAYAMTHPDQWRKNLRDNNGYKTLKYFHDFHYDKTFSNNDHLFFGNVDWGWKQTKVDGRDLYQTIFHLDADAFTQNLDNFGLRFVYGDASFSSNATVNFTLMQYEGTNLKTSSKGKYSVYSPGQDYFITQYYNDYDKFPSDMSYSAYLPRYATGSDLCKGQEKVKYDVHSPLANCEDVYVYNRLFGIFNDKTPLKELTPEILYTPTDGSGYYQPGDVVIDEDGCRWFCLLGSPFNAPIPGMHQDHAAYFFSLEGIQLSADGKTATNIITEEELPSFLFYFTSFFLTLSDMPDEFKYKSLAKPGVQNEHILDYADVDINKIFVKRDSTWRFYDYEGNRYFDSESVNGFFNVAYNSGNPNAQSIARMVMDITQAGTQRNPCPDGRYKDHHTRAYKHYFEVDKSLAQMPDSLEKLMGLTQWHMPWAISDLPITLQDVTDMRYVAGLARNDKWVTLPWHVDGDWVDISGERGKPRTMVEESADPADFLWVPTKRDFATKKTHMYNEPVLFIRMMKVWDTGRFPTLQSMDGKVKFSILHHLNNKAGYSMSAGRIWANPFMVTRLSQLEIDNQKVEIPNLEGWIE